MFRASLRFEDDHVETVDVPPGCNVLKAALSAGVGLASQCQSGSCGTCVAQLRGGRTEPVPGRATAMLDSEYQEGGRLLCSTLLESDASFEMPYPSDVIFGDQPRPHTGRVTELRPLAETVVGLRVQLDEPLGFRAGQYARIRVPGTGDWRSYSMASPPASDRELEFHIRLLPDGMFSDFLRGRCEPGTELELEAAYGAFLLRPGKDRHRLFVAGGTGLAPVMSMIDDLRENGGRRAPVTLCFACHTEADLYHEEEVGLRPMWMPQMVARMAVTEPRDGGRWQGRAGTPVSLIAAEDVREDTDAYLCGPPGMIEAARRRLRELGLPAERIHSEQFVPSEE